MKILVWTICTAFALSLMACAEKQESKPDPSLSAESPGEAIVKKNCKVCHAQGLNGAPILGNKKMWIPRMEKGLDTLVKNASTGYGLMPPKGGAEQLDSEEIRLAVTYMLEQVK